MKLFINGETFRSSAVELVEDGSNTIMKITYLKEESSGKYDKFELILPEKVNFEKLIEGVNLRKNKNKFKFIKRDGNDNELYAIFHTDQQVPGDVFIPSDLKEVIEILKKFEYWDIEPDYGEFKGIIYFIKIKIKKGIPITIYTGFKNGGMCNKYIFNKLPNGLINVEKSRIYKKVEDYISLSDF